MFRQPHIVAIGIGGGAGCGKTTLARALELELNGRAQVLSMDSYFRDFGSLSKDDLEETNFDDPSAYHMGELRVALSNLLNGREVLAPIYDLKKSVRVGSNLLKPRPFVIVEGLFALQDPILRKMFDLRVFVDASEKCRIKRQLDRIKQGRGGDVESRTRRIHKFVTPMHIRLIEPSRKYADLCVKNEGDDHHEIAFAVREIIQNLRVAC